MRTSNFVAPLMFWSKAVSAAEIEIAVRALDRGDYSNALISFNILADSGNPRAQCFLGDMHANGYGVSKDLEIAIQWYEQAARQGLCQAQAALGYAYASGCDGVIQDRLQAYAWLHMAAAGGDDEAAKVRDHTAAKLSEHELRQARSLSQELREQCAG